MKQTCGACEAGKALFSLHCCPDSRCTLLHVSTGASSASQQSSTLHASLEDELGTSVPAPSPPVEVPAMNSRRPAAVISSSMMPTRTGPAYPRLVCCMDTRLVTAWWLCSLWLRHMLILNSGSKCMDSGGRPSNATACMHVLHC